ncbi:hypothetical protein [Bathymodiolus japonicus methanotrophic gill symbiont]|uniref:hypothetical protein n=1 Tax=Bathymodiolus japonicus methanotrophic gill symbiont TaxID=113269 RepID=UPI001C8E3351|nr:hypothetical protein [Bathymodiolus japonicus methanotrophic gill symbiont]
MCSVCGGRRAAGASPIRCVGERITATGVPEFREVAWRACNSINKGIDQIIRVRGGKEIKVTVSSARLKVSSHSKKRFVIALKYDGENDYRYLVRQT